MAYKIGTVTLTGTFTLGGSLNTTEGGEIDRNTSLASAFFSGSIGGHGASATVDMFGYVPVSGTADPTILNVTVTAQADGETAASNYQSLDPVSLTGTISVTVPCDVVWEYVSVSSNPFFDRIVDSPLYLKRRYYLVGNGDASASITVAGVTVTKTQSVRGVEIPPSVSQNGNCSSTYGLAYTPDEVYGGFYPTASVPGSASATIAVSTNIPSGTVTSSSATKSLTETYSSPHGHPDVTVSSTSAASASAGGLNLSSSNAGASGASSNFEAVRNWTLSGVIRAMENPYPDTLTLVCDGTFTASSSFSRSGSQVHYQTTAGAATGPVHSPDASDAADAHALNTFTDLSVSIDPESLSAVGDEPLAHRILFRGESDVPGLTIAQAASFVIDDMGGTISVTGPATLTRTYSTPKSFCSYRYLRVRLRSVGSAGQAAKINIGGFNWNLTTGADGTYVDRDIDLCSPDSVTTAALNDTWDTRWPVPTAASVTSGPFRVDSVTFNNIVSGSTIEFDSLTLVRVNAPTIDFLPTLYPSRYIIPGSGDPAVVPQWPAVAIQNVERSVGTAGEGTSNDWVRRFLLANSDGRQTVEETDFWYTRTVAATSGVTTYSFNMPSLSGLAAQINNNGDLPFYAPWNLGTDPAGSQARWPGWTATPALAAPAAFTPTFTGQSPPANPYFYNADVQQASFLFGGGALYQGGWTYGFDRAAGTFPSQPLFDIIELCGMAGDVFGHGGGTIGGGGTCTLVAAAILRAQSHGLFFDSSTGDPAAAQTVELRQSSVTVGTGTSRADGWYHTTGISAKPPNGTISVRPVPGSPLSLGTSYTRHRHRGSLIYVPILPAHSPRGLNTRQGGYYGSAVVRGQTRRGRIQWRRTAGEQVRRDNIDWSVEAYVSSPSALQGDEEPWAWYEARDSSLHILYTRATYPAPGGADPTIPTGTVVREAVSFDDGATWAETALTGSSTMARHPHAMTEPGSTGGTLRAWYVRGIPGDTGDLTHGTLVGTWQGAGDAAASSPFTLKFHNGTALTPLLVWDDVFGLTYAHEAQGRYNLVVMIKGEGEPANFYSGDDGKTWTRVTGTGGGTEPA